MGSFVKNMKDGGFKVIKAGLTMMFMMSCVAYGAEVPLCSEVAPNGQGYGVPFVLNGITYRKINEEWANSSLQEFWCRTSAEEPTLAIEGASEGGEGCPGFHEAEVTKIRDNYFALDTSSMVAQIKNPPQYISERAICYVTLKVKAPLGWSYSLDSVTTNGYASFSNGVTGSVGVMHYFTGRSSEGRLKESLQGPINDLFSFKSLYRSSSQVWSPCNNSALYLNVVFEIRLSKSSRQEKSGLIVLDPEKELGFVLRKCR
jgi:hypothetical protein